MAVASEIKLKRYPASSNKSLQAWSAADEHIVQYLAENKLLLTDNFCIYNDSFGYLATHLQQKPMQIICDSYGQKRAIQKNLENNHKSGNYRFIQPLEELRDRPDFGIIKMPKSLDLFELYLQHFVTQATDKSSLVCGFMTRHFTKNCIEIAEKYFNQVNQSRAVKKSRVLILSDPKNIQKTTLTHTIPFEDKEYQQYYGVFSSKIIDPATQFLLTHLSLEKTVEQAMDLGCGNGILADRLLEQHPEAEIVCLDDSSLAIESAKLNIDNSKVRFVHRDDLSDISDNYMDYIFTNPPFHLGHEIDIQTPIRLFRDVHRCLKTGGELRIVANLHLNYKTHLVPIFDQVNIIEENTKFVIYSCIK